MTEARELYNKVIQGNYCIGCGNCVVKCPVEAISLKKRDKQFIPFPTLDDLFDKISERKKRLEQKAK